MNKIFLVGNLSKEPELSETSNGVSVCSFNVAINRPYQSSDGEKQVDFFRVTAWRTVAENCGRYLKKGSKIALVGSLQNRQFEDKDGNKKQVTEIIASEVEFLTSKGKEESNDD